MKEVRNAFDFPVKSKERKKAISMFRNDSNFDLYVSGTVRPKKQVLLYEKKKYYPCIFCKGVFRKSYLNRHSKICNYNLEKNINQKNGNIVSRSQTEVACFADPTNLISRLEVKEQVS